MSQGTRPPFRRLAIVNRGEPAMRLINAVREWNEEGRPPLRTIAVYTAADRRAMFVRAADEAVLIGPAAVGRRPPHDLPGAARPRGAEGRGAVARPGRRLRALPGGTAIVDAPARHRAGPRCGSAQPAARGLGHVRFPAHQPSAAHRDDRRGRRGARAVAVRYGPGGGRDPRNAPGRCSRCAALTPTIRATDRAAQPRKDHG